MKTLVNLTQHQFANKQRNGFDRCVDTDDEVRSLITFTAIPSREELAARAAKLAEMAMASGATHAMIGGAPYFMAPLEVALKEAGVQPLYAFTERKVVEKPQPDGTVVKTAVFEHAGWVEA